MSDPTTSPKTTASPPPAAREARSSWLRNLALRLTTAAVGIPIILWMLYLAPRVTFSIFALLVSFVGGTEIAAMTLKGDRPLQVLQVVLTVTVTAVLVFAPAAEALLGLLFGIVLLAPLAVLIRVDPMPSASARMAWLIAGPLYIGGAIAAIAMLHHLEHGGTWVVLAMSLAWGSDTGGYFAGRAFGRHKLYEKVSPKKTIEGSIGGLLAVVAFALVIRWFWLPELSWMHATVLALTAGAVGQAGDLCVSVIKRSTGVKDSGHIIPGHGGLLDRIDALMFTAVVSLVYTRWVLALPAQVPSLFSE